MTEIVLRMHVVAEMCDDEQWEKKITPSIHPPQLQKYKRMQQQQQILVAASVAPLLLLSFRFRRAPVVHCQRIYVMS
jgi:hypothetical protein